MNMLLLPDGVPYLSMIWLVVLAGALVCAVLPRAADALLRWVATATSAVALVLTILVFLDYNPAGITFQFVERLAWVPDYGITYFLGADGLAVPMLALIAVVLFAGVLVSWNVEERPKEFFALLLLLGAGLFVAVMALDLMLLLFGIGLVVVASFGLRAAWGAPAARDEAVSMATYLLGGTLSILGGVLLIYFAGGRTMNLVELAQINDFPVVFQAAAFVPLFGGFAVLAGLFPFHGWLPRSLHAAPPALAMTLAGVLLSLGAYGCLRVALWLLPAGAVVWSPVLVALALLSLLYGAVMALWQRDLAGVWSYAALSRSGLALLGLAILNATALDGAALLLFAQGLTMATIFAVVGRMIAERTGTTQLAELGEIGRIIPFAAAVAIIASLSHISFGFTTFLGTSAVVQGAWARYPVVAIIAIVGLVSAVAYVLRVMRAAFFGAARNVAVAQLSRLSWQEYVVGALLVALLVGVFPVILHPLSLAGVGPTVQRLADADALVRAAGNPFFGR
jgi:NADH-quinone oxidoreductase subunit M